MAKYKLTDPENLTEFKRLARIAYNLRYYSKIWKEHYGAVNRKQMNVWEENMDEWIEKNIVRAVEIDPEEEINKNVSWQINQISSK